MSAADGRRRGIRAPLKRVVAHATALARLERELARAELERKAATMGAGAGAGLAAALTLVFAMGFGFAAVAAALALVVPWWLALLLVFLGLLGLTAALALVSRSLFRNSTPLKPEQAIDEARLTKQVVRGARAG
jgi:protein-S-isoprenylcysteine O-methyltransferase Ste14